jgi:hypothetical protein
MVKFRTSSSEAPKPESVVLMFRDLDRDPSVKYLYSHQDKVLEGYYQKHLQSKDLAIELPTGTGKTLVGLLIAEYRRRASKERIVFLCPTKQLCFQVNEQARRYGIKTALLVGSQSQYNSALFYDYQQGKAIAITTYSGVFNTNPRINDPEVIICDDAHAADNYIADLWTLSIGRATHKDLYMSLYRVLESVIPDHMAHKIETGGSSRFDEYSVDLISTIASYEFITQIVQTIGAFISKYSDLEYTWSVLSSHLEACSLYISPKSIEIRPLIPPTQTHSPFSDAEQRIYMSATLGEDGDIERVFGVKKIARLPIPEEWHRRSTGRRLILFPCLSDNQKPVDTAIAMLREVDRALILVPDNKTLEGWETKLPKSHTIIKSGQIEQNLEAFTKCSKPSVLLLATRYDGIDLPGDDCRFMILDGEPSASGLQEMYMRTGLGAYSQLHNRIRTRVTQALGRCTRDESDYSVVVVLGDKLTQRCCTTSFTQGIHPEIQAEIAFGLDNSKEHETVDFVELAETLLKRLPDWQEAERDIRKRRDSFSKILDSTAEALKKSMPHELDYVYASWRGQHEDALNIATKVLAALEGGDDLKPYRAFWYHQAATSAFLAWQHSNNESFKFTAISNLEKASDTSRNIAWLDRLRSQLSGKAIDDPRRGLPTQEWFLRISNLLEQWKIVGGNYPKQVSKVQNSIENKEAKVFEKGLNLLGQMLGANTHQWADDGAPDGLWIFDDWCAFVFEAKTNESPDGGISLDTVTQARRHEERVRADKLIPSFMPCFTVVISPRTSIHKLSIPHVEEISYISHEEVVKLFNDTSIGLERVRSAASGSTEEALQVSAVRVYSEKSVAPQDVKERLIKTKLGDLPVQ